MQLTSSQSAFYKPEAVTLGNPVDGGGGADEAGGAVLVGADVLMMNCMNIKRNISGSCVVFHKRVIIEILHLWKEIRGKRVEKRKTKV